MDKSLIIILAVILLILVLLNNLSLVVPDVQVHTVQGNCSQTTFGCCPDAINSKINFNGTNCPNYNPGAGYPAAHNKPSVVVTHQN